MNSSSVPRHPPFSDVACNTHRSRHYITSIFSYSVELTSSLHLYAHMRIPRTHHLA